MRFLDKCEVVKDGGKIGNFPEIITVIEEDGNLIFSTQRKFRFTKFYNFVMNTEGSVIDFTVVD